MKLDFATATASTERAYELQPSPRTQINRAMVAFLGGDLPQALENARAVRERAPALMQAWYVEGKVLMARGDLPAARALYDSMVVQGGDMQMEGHNGLADVARSTGRPAEARTQLLAARAAALARGNASIATSAAVQLAELALEAADTARFRETIALAAPGGDPWLVYVVGRAWARAGRAAEATEAVHRIEALSIGPSPQHEALKALLRAELALTTGSPADAVAEAQAAVRFEGSTVAHETLARAFLATGRSADAAAEFAQVVARPQERCESYDAPACYRVTDAAYWLGRLKDEARRLDRAP
jgi:tetratricopeptide (TPR) repeat protein